VAEGRVRGFTTNPPIVIGKWYQAFGLQANGEVAKHKEQGAAEPQWIRESRQKNGVTGK
jgi:hypothetical protein